MGFRPRTEITSLFTSLMGRLTASLSGRFTAFLPQISKLVGLVMATGVLTVARFVGKVGCYLLVASLSGRLRASLSGRLTAFLPPDHKADGFRHCDGGTHGGEICWESRMLPLGCESRDASGRPSRDASRRSTPQITKPVGPVIATGVCSRWRDLLGKSEVTSWLRVSRDASGRPSRDASRHSSLQITKPVGPVIATGVLTVARFVGKVGSYLLVASLSGRLRASLSGRFTASHPPGLVTEEARHRDGGARGVETCADDPLASQQPCRGLLGPEALPLVGRAPGCDLSDPSQVMEPRGPTSHTAMAMDPVHGNQSSFGSTDVTLTAQ